MEKPILVVAVGGNALLQPHSGNLGGLPRDG